MDPSFYVQWVVPLEGNEAEQNLNLGLEEKRRYALETARDHHKIVITHPIDLVQGVRDFWLISLFTETKTLKDL